MMEVVVERVGEEGEEDKEEEEEEEGEEIMVEARKVMWLWQQMKFRRLLLSKTIHTNLFIRVGQGCFLLQWPKVGL